MNKYELIILLSLKVWNMGWHLHQLYAHIHQLSAHILVVIVSHLWRILSSRFQAWLKWESPGELFLKLATQISSVRIPGGGQQACGFLKAPGEILMQELRATAVDLGRSSIISCWPEALTHSYLGVMKCGWKRRALINLWGFSYWSLWFRQHFILWRAQMCFSFTMYFIFQPNVSVKMVGKKSLSWFCGWMERAIQKLNNLIRFIHLEQTQISRFLSLLSSGCFSLFALRFQMREGEGGCFWTK